MSYAYVSSGRSGMLLESSSVTSLAAEHQRNEAAAMMQKFSLIVGPYSIPQEPGDNAIGSLAAELGLVSKFDLIDARELSSYNSIPFGLGLLTGGCINRLQLAVLLRAQALLMDQVASRDEILRATREVFSDSRISLRTALSRIKWVRPNHPTNTLGELLISADLLTQLQFARIHNLSNQSMLPLGRVMVLLGFLSSSMVDAALDMQREIRKGRMNRHDGVMKLRSLASRATETMPRNPLGYKSKSKRPLLGELLIEAGVLSTTDVVCAVSIAQPRQKMFGEVLREFNWISERLLQDALVIQKLVDFQVVSRFQAVKVLKLVVAGKAMQSALDSVLCALNFERKQIFFRQLIKHVQIHNVSILDLELVENIFVQGRIEADRAILLLNHCMLTSLRVEMVLAKLGWTVEINVPGCRYSGICNL